jgi:hypothetical protein
MRFLKAQFGIIAGAPVTHHRVGNPSWRGSRHGMAMRWRRHRGGSDMGFLKAQLGIIARCAGDTSSCSQSIAARLEARHGDALAQSHRRH